MPPSETTQLSFLSSAKCKLSEKAQATLKDAQDSAPHKHQKELSATKTHVTSDKGDHMLTKRAHVNKGDHVSTMKACANTSDGHRAPTTKGQVNERDHTSTVKTCITKRNHPSTTGTGSTMTAMGSTSHCTTVHTKEEEDSLHGDAEVIVIPSDEEPEDQPALGPEEKLESLMKEWTAPVYTFFHPRPTIVEVDGRQAHDFKCAARACKVKVCRYMDTKDAQSMSNLQKHVKACKGWGKQILKAADQAKNAEEVQVKLIGRFLRDGTITVIFKRKGKGQVTYSHRQHTHEETRYVPPTIFLC